jgi:hypothetical protein
MKMTFDDKQHHSHVIAFWAENTRRDLKGRYPSADAYEADKDYARDCVRWLTASPNHDAMGFWYGRQSN